MRQQKPDNIQDGQARIIDAEIRLAGALIDLDRHSEAAEACRRVIALRPGHAEASRTLVIALAAQRFNDDRVDTLATKYRDIVARHLDEGYALAANQAHADAVVVFRAILRHVPGHAAASVAMARSLAACHASDPAEAADVLAAAASKHPDDVAVQAEFGRALIAAGRIDTAIVVLNQAVALDRSRPRLYRDLARAHRTAGALRKASESFARFTELAPDDAAGHHDLGRALAAEGRHDEAAEALRRALALQPDRVLAHRDLARTLQAKGDTGSAIAAFTRFAELSPKDALAHHDLGRAQLAAAQHDAAISSLRRSIALAPQRAPAHRDLARALKALDRIAEASASLAAYLALQPDDAAAHHDHGHWLIALGRRDDAAGAFARAHALQPHRPGLAADLERAAATARAEAPAAAGATEIAAKALVRGRELAGQDERPAAANGFADAVAATPDPLDAHLRQASAEAAVGRYDDAARSLAAAAALSPNDAKIARELGRTLTLVGRTNQAIEALRTAARLCPDWPMVHRDLAKALKSAGRAEEAAASFAHFAMLAPQDAAGHHDLARALMGLSRHEEAIPELRHTLSLRPDRTSAFRDLARCLKLLGRLDEAIEALRSELALDPTQINAVLELGRLLNRQKRFEHAADVFKQALDLDERHAEAHHGLGVACRRLGRAAPARACFERALAIDPARPTTLLQLAEMAQLDGDLEAALAHADALLTMRPEHISGRILRAQVHFERGDREAARGDLEEALRIQPGHAKSTLYLEMVVRSLAEDGTSDCVAVCLLRPLAAADEPAVDSLLDKGVSVFARRGRARHGGVVQVRGDWRDCLRAADADWVLVSAEALPSASQLAAFRQRTGARIGLVTADRTKPASLGLWRQPLLQAGLDMMPSRARSWGWFAATMPARLRVRTLEPLPAPAASVAPAPAGGEVWLVSSSGVKLFGGVEQFLRTMVPLYRALGYAPVIVGLLESLAGVPQEGAVEDIPFINLPRTITGIRAAALARMPVIVQGTTGIGYELAAGLDGLETRLIYGSHFWRDMFHGADSFENVDRDGRPRAEFRALCVAADQAYANSRYTQEVIARHFDVVQPILYSLPFDRAAARRATPGSYVLLMNGRPDKGFALLLPIALALPDIAFRVVASQVSRARIEGEIAAAGANNITVVDWAEDTGPLYKNARVVIVPSYSFVETFSRVVIEAHRHGVPVIGSDRGNVPLLLERSGTVLPEDVAEWVPELRRLFNDGDYWSERHRLALENSARFRFADQQYRLERLIQSARMRIGIAVGSGIGNMVQCSPAIRRLSQHFECPIDVVLNEDFPGCTSLFAGSPWVGSVFSSSDDLPQKYFRVLIVLDCFGALLPRCNADLVVVTRRQFGFDLMRATHEAVFNMTCLRDMLGVPCSEADAAQYFVGGFDRGVPIRRRIGLHAGGKAGAWAVKRWPHFAQLAATLRHVGFEVVSLGAPDELVAGTADLTGTDLPTTIRNIQSCEYFIANDSGLMHIADALGVPLTAIFGPTSVVKNGPLAASSQVINLDKDCAPCQFTPELFSRCTCIAEISLHSVLAGLSAHFDQLGLAPKSLLACPVDEDGPISPLTSFEPPRPEA